MDLAGGGRPAAALSHHRRGPRAAYRGRGRLRPHAPAQCSSLRSNCPQQRIQGSGRRSSSGRCVRAACRASKGSVRTCDAAAAPAIRDGVEGQAPTPCSSSRGGRRSNSTSSRSGSNGASLQPAASSRPAKAWGPLLTSFIAACTSPAELCDLVQHNEEHLNHLHVTAMATRLAHLAKEGSRLGPFAAGSFAPTGRRWTPAASQMCVGPRQRWPAPGQVLPRTAQLPCW